MGLTNLINIFIRYVYLFAMYSGIRAVVNRALSTCFPVPRVSVLDETVIRHGKHTALTVRVHARRPPSSSGAQAAGMISVFLKTPRISRSIYSLLRLTSHFGCGHIEVAFYERDATVCVFAIRNILGSNLHRLGCRSYFGSLPLLGEGDEVLILRTIMNELRQRGLNVEIAAPEECVALAVSHWLLQPKTRHRSLAALTRRYRRLTRQTSLPDIAIGPS